MINVNMYGVDKTYNVIEHEKLDVHIIVLGISLLDCVDSNLEALNERIYRKVTTLTKDLASTGQNVEANFGIPIVNKRISITPIALVGGSACKRPEDFVTIAKTLDLAAREVDVNSIGGYSALMSEGMTGVDKDLILSVPQVLSQTGRVCSSVNVGSTKTGTDMGAMELMGRIMTETAEATRNHDSLGCAKLVVFCDAPDDDPFMTDILHGVTESEAIINVGVSGPGIVKIALAEVRDANFEVLCETVKKTAFKITRVGQLVAQEASRCMDTPFGIVDPSLAPTPSVGGSVAEILEEIGLERMGAPGATTALTILNDQMKEGGTMASSYVDGLSGTFIPISEDQEMAGMVGMGALTVEKLEAMIYVCSAGLDMITMPGDTPSSIITGAITDEAAIGMVNQKATAVRLISTVGKKVGEAVELDGLLDYAPVMPVSTFSCRRFVTRGGRIPAPIRSFEN